MTPSEKITAKELVQKLFQVFKDMVEQSTFKYTNDSSKLEQLLSILSNLNSIENKIIADESLILNQVETKLSDYEEKVKKCLIKEIEVPPPGKHDTD